jgi:hypothetical protein
LLHLIVQRSSISILRVAISVVTSISTGWAMVSASAIICVATLLRSADRSRLTSRRAAMLNNIVERAGRRARLRRSPPEATTTRARWGSTARAEAGLERTATSQRGTPPPAPASAACFATGYS